MAELYRLFQESESRTSFDPGTERQPRNVQAERIVLGSLLRRNRILDSVIDILLPSHFFDKLHGRLYEEICRRIVDDVPVSTVTLIDWTTDDPTFGGSNGKANVFLAGVLAAGIAGDVRGHAICIRDCAERRDIIETANKILSVATDARTGLKDRIPELAAKLDGTILGSDRKNVATFDEAVTEAIQQAEQAKARGGAGGLPLPSWPRLSRAIVLLPQEMTIIGGLTGAGKSALGWQLAIDIARYIRDNNLTKELGCVIGFSLEMKKASLAIRCLSTISGVPATDIQRGWITEYQLELVKSAADELAGLPIELIDINGLTKEQIKAHMYRVQLKHKKIALCIIDHLNLVSQGVVGERHGIGAGTSDTANAALGLCKTFNCHMVGLVQLLLKDIQRRPKNSRRPTLADLYGSMHLAANADNVILLHRPIMFESDEPPEKEESEYPNDYERRRSDWEFRREDLQNKAEAIVAKVRMGRAGFGIKLLFDEKTTSFSEDPSVPL